MAVIIRIRLHKLRGRRQHPEPKQKLPGGNNGRRLVSHLRHSRRALCPVRVVRGANRRQA